MIENRPTEDRSDGPEWFAPKRFGLGTGLPIAWQGWLVLIIFLFLIFAPIFLFPENVEAQLAIWIPAGMVFMLIAAKTTRGGWRWRWGRED